MSAGPPTIYVVDDDLSHGVSVARLLRGAGFRAQSFASAAEFLQSHGPEASGCVVSDLQMPDMTGLELQEALTQSGNPLPVVFLTGAGDIPTSVRAMRKGAEDFLTKTAPMEALLAAVNRALERDARDRSARDGLQEVRQRFQRLTPRERQVLTHVLQGRLNKQIAADLGIDERSVKRHRSSLMAKLEVRSVAQLSQLASLAGTHA